jgi:hypothetical protein
VDRRAAPGACLCGRSAARRLRRLERLVDFVWRERKRRAGDSKYFAIYQAKDWPEALWLRLGRASVFEEQRKASDTPAEPISGLADDAFWWDYAGMQRGIAVLAGDSTYEVIAGYAWNKPQVTDAQLMEVAKTVVGRL